jgi:hypothetical protein
MGLRRTLLVLVVLMTFAFGWFTIEYRSLMWWSKPVRIHVLGRDYLLSGGPTETAVQMRRDSGGRQPKTVGHLPLGQAILAVTGTYVPTVIYVHGYWGGYASYALSGGP